VPDSYLQGLRFDLLELPSDPVFEEALRIRGEATEAANRAFLTENLEAIAAKQVERLAGALDGSEAVQLASEPLAKWATTQPKPASALPGNDESEQELNVNLAVFVVCAVIADEVAGDYRDPRLADATFSR